MTTTRSILALPACLLLLAVLLGVGAVSAASARAEASPPTGRIAFINEDNFLMTANPDGTDRRRLMTYEDNSDYSGYVQHESQKPAWSPSGTRIAFAQPDLSYFDGLQDHYYTRITLMDVASERAEMIADGADPDWSPDGTKIVYAQYNPESESVWESTYGAITVMTTEGSVEVSFSNGRDPV